MRARCLLCRNRVEDYQRWRAVFDSHAEAHRAAGLRLSRIWRDADDPNNIFFLFDVADEERALVFLASPDSAEAGAAAGVLDGEFHFVTEDRLY